jgi:hypothetical protein
MGDGILNLGKRMEVMIFPPEKALSLTHKFDEDEIQLRISTLGAPGMQKWNSLQW